MVVDTCVHTFVADAVHAICSCIEFARNADDVRRSSKLRRNSSGVPGNILWVILGFELERRRDSKNRKERLVGALEMIKDEIERNIGLCEQIQNELTKDPGFVQYYLLKTTTWTSVASVLVDLKSPKLAKQIASEYFDYEHLNRRINARFEFFKTGDPSNVIHARAFANITGSVIVGVKDLQVSSKNVVNAIKTQLDQMK